MTATQTRVVGPVMLPDGSPAPDGAIVRFILPHWDKDGDAIIAPGTIEAVVTAGEIDVDLWRTSVGGREQTYLVSVIYQNDYEGRRIECSLGHIYLTATSPVQLSALLGLPAPMPDLPDALVRAETAVVDARAGAALSRAWAESPTAPDPDLPASKSAKTLAGEAVAAVDAIPSVMAPHVTKAQAWAESPTAPDPDVPASKSAKTLAGEAAAAAGRAEASAARIDLGELDDAVALATSSASAADAAALAAGLARDAATVNANVYADTATGLAATSDGEQFIVVEANQLVRYRRVTASVATPVARYPASTAITGIGVSDFDAITANGSYYGTNAVGAPVSGVQVVVQHYETTRAYQFALAQWPGTGGTKERQFFRFRTASGWRPWRETAAMDDLGPLAQAPRVPPSAQVLGDRSSLNPDPASVDPSLYSGVAVTSMTPTVGAVPALRKSATVMALPSSAGAQEVFGPAFPVDPLAAYVISASGGRSTGVGSCTTRFMANWYSDHAATTLISSERIGADHTGTAPSKRKAKLTAPSNAVACKISFQKDVSASPIVSAFYDVDIVRAVEAIALPEPEPYTPPTIDAIAGMVMHVSQFPLVPNTTLFAKGATTAIPPASLTKVLSALVAIRAIRELGSTVDDFDVEVTAADEVGGSGANISAGDVLSLRDALTDMMLPSSNNAAMAVARNIGNALGIARGVPGGVAGFVAEMGIVATEIGMVNSTFINPTGLAASGQVTTVSDINTLMAAALKEASITSIWGLATADLSIGGPNARTVSVSHSIPIMTDADILGGKSGTLTPSVYSASVVVRAPRQNLIVATVLQSSTSAQRYVDLRAMIDAVTQGAEWPVLVPQLRQ